MEIAVWQSRLERVREAADVAGVDALMIVPGPELRYLIGSGKASYERLTALVVPRAEPAALVVPALEAPGYAAAPLDALGIEVLPWRDGSDPYALAAERLGEPERVAISDGMTARHVLPLRQVLGDAEQMLAGPIVSSLRIRKDAAEVAALRRAGAAIDRVHARVGEWLRPGRTEAEAGADIATAIVAEGHELADFVIVASGPNGASPHHALSDRVIEPGDVVVVDIGGPFPDGYNSDSTRTYSIGEPRDPDVTDAYAVLQAAQQAAVDAARPGVTAEAVDAAARDVIAAAGFGEVFLHRTGHGIGLEVHEEPYIVAGNDLVLEPGMAFSVEPGVYFAGRWGARIEDIVVLTDSGAERLNNRPHDLVALG
jgi:Xaa-Pro aminopeptidase